MRRCVRYGVVAYEQRHDVRPQHGRDDLMLRVLAYLV